MSEATETLADILSEPGWEHWANEHYYNLDDEGEVYIRLEDRQVGLKLTFSIYLSPECVYRAADLMRRLEAAIAREAEAGDDNG